MSFAMETSLRSRRIVARERAALNDRPRPKDMAHRPRAQDHYLAQLCGLSLRAQGPYLAQLCALALVLAHADAGSGAAKLHPNTVYRLRQALELGGADGCRLIEGL